MAENRQDRVNRLMAEFISLMRRDLDELMQGLALPLQGFHDVPAHRDQVSSPYRVLGLDTSATDELVKLAYKLLSQKLHPDHGGSAGAMARLNKAYEDIAKHRGWK
jgi:DnaJ-class molecular chaperone